LQEPTPLPICDRTEASAGLGSGAAPTTPVHPTLRLSLGPALRQQRRGRARKTTGSSSRNKNRESLERVEIAEARRLLNRKMVDADKNGHAVGAVHRGGKLVRERGKGGMFIKKTVSARKRPTRLSIIRIFLRSATPRIKASLSQRAPPFFGIAHQTVLSR
jgi:hypothetical protein